MREQHQWSDVVVVGGGIGGLTTALALRGAGLSVRVLEQATRFGEVGAGLQLGPNATRLLAEWGLLEQVVEAGVLPDNLVLRDAVSGAELTRQNLGEQFRRRYGGPYVVVHRSDLHDIILRACAAAGVELTTDAQVTEVRAEHRAATTHTADGAGYRSGWVVGADGFNSVLRPSVIDDQPVASGYVAYRGTVDAAELPADQQANDVVAWLGPGCHLVQYPLRRGEMLNQVAVFASPAFTRGEAEWGGPDELDQAYRDCCAPVREALGRLWRDRHWPMYDREPAPNWVGDRVLLTGDAAHPMLQYLAQGACQAIEDAAALRAAVHRRVVTADGVDLDGWDPAAKEFTAQRAPRTARVQRTARIWGQSWHVDGIARLLRNELMQRRDAADHRYLDWLYAQPGPHRATHSETERSSRA